MVKVWRYRKYDITKDDYFYSTRMGTPEWIDRIEAEKVPGTEADIDAKHLGTEGFTEKNFDPSKV
jgi:hypothetical protein